MRWSSPFIILMALLRQEQLLQPWRTLLCSVSPPYRRLFIMEKINLRTPSLHPLAEIWLCSWSVSWIGVSQAPDNKDLALPRKGSVANKATGILDQQSSSISIRKYWNFLGPQPCGCPNLFLTWQPQAPSKGFQVFSNDHGLFLSEVPKS